jgi:Flp pilus assembly protein TadD
LADDAVERARTSGDANVIATAANAAAILGRPPGREHHLRTAAEQATDPHVRIAVLNNLASTINDVEEAVAVAREAVELADAVGDRHVAAAAHNTLADALRRAGRDDAARAEVTRSVELFAGITTGIDDLDPHIWMLAEL